MIMEYDLIIVGGGLVGSGLAAALRHTGLRIALIDARLPSNNDPRLFALNMSSCCFLQNVDIWDKLLPHAAPIHQVHVSNQGRFGSVRLQREDVRLSSLGYVIPAYFIESALNDELEKISAIDGFITLYRPARLTALSQQNGIASVTVETQAGEKVLQAPIVIGADGTESSVRTLVNIKTDIFDYHQSALVTRTTLQRAHKNIAYERFNKNGAIAMLPLTGNECATIWSADSDTILRLMNLTDMEFLQTLQEEFGYRLGRLQSISKRHTFPLRMVRADKAVDQCVMLLGNSAHTLHPIAAQGFNLALYEVAALVDGINAKLEKNEIFTAADLPTIYEQTKKHQAKTMGVSHRLSRVFSESSGLMNVLLQAGMVGFDLALPIKKRFIDGILGRRGRLPELMNRG